MNKCVLVLDTSSLINHPNIFSLLENKYFVLPIEVLEELDNCKVRNDVSGFNARKANRIIDGIIAGKRLAEGVDFGQGNTLKVSMESDLNKVPSIFSQNVDSKIISIAKKYKDEEHEVKLVSSDIALRIKASSIGIDAISDDELIMGNEDLLYSGSKVLHTEQENIDSIYRDGFVTHTRTDLFPNQSIVLKSEDNSSAIGIVKGNRIVKLNKKDPCILGVSPKNKEQRFAFEYLLDENIPMVSLAGIAGTGKTMIAAITAMHMLQEGIYDKLVICRPAVSISEGIGFLPGTKEEKMQPWVQPIFDNLKHIMKCTDMYFDLLIEKGKIEVESLSYIRGRTFPKTVMIIDEAQNSTPAEMKAIITRMGEKSKLIITGDLEQIDNQKLDLYSSGLSVVANKFKQSHLTAHITLNKSERSELAALAAKLM